MTKDNTSGELKIAVDTWVLGSQSRNHGVHEYTAQLLGHFRELAASYGVEIQPYVCAGAENDANSLTAAPGFQPRETGLLRRSRTWRLGGAYALACLRGVDLVFNPHCISWYGSRAPVVTTIHDLIPLVLPWPSRVVKTLRFLLRSAAKSSRAIITGSGFSKADIVNLLGVPESRVTVIYDGCDHAVFNSSSADPVLLASVLRQQGIQRSYVLHYGAIKPNKNLPRLIQAHRNLVDRNPNLDFDLVLAGTASTGYDDVLAAVRRCSGARGRVVLTGALSKQDLVALIQGASLAVFPSLYEGFCLPMIESMACGTPTIAANASCLPEISGGVLRYFDPLSVEEMSACMEAVLEDREAGAQLSAKGKERAQEFTWRSSAEKTLALLAKTAAAVRDGKTG